VAFREDAPSATAPVLTAAGQFTPAWFQFLVTLPSPGSGVDTANSPNAGEIARFTDADTIEGLTEGEFKAAFNLEAGTDFLSPAAIAAAYQPLDVDLTQIAALANVAGDILYTDATPEWNRLAKGTDGQVLTLASGLPSWADASGGAWEYIGQVTASGGTVDFTGLSSSYILYMFVLTDIDISANAILEILTDSDNGASYDTGASDYTWSWGKNTATYAGGADSADSEIELTDTLNGTGSTFISGIVYLFNPAGTGRTHMTWHLSTVDSAGGHVAYVGHGERLAAAAVDAIRLQVSTGNLAGGVVRAYGLVPS